MPYQWILFDADGTLLDFERAAGLALQATCEQELAGFEPRYQQIYSRINTGIWRELETGQIAPEALKTERFARFFAALEIKADPESFGEKFLDSLGHYSSLLDGAAAVVEELARTTKLMIITNGLRQVQRRRFTENTIGRFFEGLVISEEVGAAKPDTKIFDAAFARMGQPPKNQVLIVGDSLTSDIRGGNNYGIDTCWYNPQHRANDQGVTIRYEIHQLNELPALISHCR